MGLKNIEYIYSTIHFDLLSTVPQTQKSFQHSVKNQKPRNNIGGFCMCLNTFILLILAQMWASAQAARWARFELATNWLHANPIFIRTWTISSPSTKPDRVGTLGCGALPAPMFTFGEIGEVLPCGIVSEPALPNL